MINPIKLAYATGIVLPALMLASVFTYEAPKPDPVPAVQTVQTKLYEQLPFDTPSWVPNEATKRKALLRAYELNGDRMCCGSIDVSKEDLTEHVRSDAPAHAYAAVEVIDPAEHNVLDDAVDKTDWDARRKFMNRTFRSAREKLANADEDKPVRDICKRHGMHKVVYGDKWRCRK